MTKIYFKKLSSEGPGGFVDYSVKEARKIVRQALKEQRIVVNIAKGKRVEGKNFKFGEDDSLRIFPIVGGG